MSLLLVGGGLGWKPSIDHGRITVSLFGKQYRCGRLIERHVNIEFIGWRDIPGDRRILYVKSRIDGGSFAVDHGEATSRIRDGWPQQLLAFLGRLEAD
jgi:hypothetical protein